MCVNFFSTRVDGFFLKIKIKNKVGEIIYCHKKKGLSMKYAPCILSIYRVFGLV